MLRKWRDQFPAEIVEVKILPAVSLGSPYEVLAVIEELHRGRIFRPARQPFLANDDAALAGVWIRGAKLHNVLPPVRAMKQQLAVARPRDSVNVMADDRVIERFAVAHINLHRFLRRDVVNENVHHWI